MDSNYVLIVGNAQKEQSKHAPFCINNAEMIRKVYKGLGTLKGQNVKLFYKYHPIEKTRINNLKSLNKNIIFISDLSIKTCCKYMDVGVCNVSQACYDILCLQKPVIMLGLNQITNSGAVYRAFNYDELCTAINDSLTYGLTTIQNTKLLST